MVLRQLLDTVELALEQLVLAPTRQGSSAWFQPNLKCKVQSAKWVTYRAMT